MKWFKFKKKDYRWKHLIPKNPSKKEFELAWDQIYKYPFSAYKMTRLSDLKLRFDFHGAVLNLQEELLFENIEIYLEKEYGELVTEEPILFSESERFFTGVGCSWGEDRINRRY